MKRTEALRIQDSIAIISDSYGPELPSCEKIVLFHIWHTDIALLKLLVESRGFFYSSILICMFDSFQLCSLKDIQANPKM